MAKHNKQTLDRQFLDNGVVADCKAACFQIKQARNSRLLHRVKRRKWFGKILFPTDIFLLFTFSLILDLFINLRFSQYEGYGNFARTS